MYIVQLVSLILYAEFSAGNKSPLSLLHLSKRPLILKENILDSEPDFGINSTGSKPAFVFF